MVRCRGVGMGLRMRFRVRDERVGWTISLAFGWE
jgi:hypothetical protein